MNLTERTKTSSRSLQVDTDTDTKIIFKNRKYYPVPVHLIEILPFVKTRKIKKELQYKMKEKYDDLNTIKNNKN